MWETPPRGVALQHAPPAPAPDRSRSGRPPASASLGLLADMFCLARPHWPCFHRAGDIYSGEWSKGKKHGEGTYFAKLTSTKLKGASSATTLTQP